MQQEQSLLIGHIMDIYNDAKLEIYTLAEIGIGNNETSVKSTLT